MLLCQANLSCISRLLHYPTAFSLVLTSSFSPSFAGNMSWHREQRRSSSARSVHPSTRSRSRWGRLLLLTSSSTTVGGSGSGNERKPRPGERSQRVRAVCEIAAAADYLTLPRTYNNRDTASGVVPALCLPDCLRSSVDVSCCSLCRARAESRPFHLFVSRSI